MLNIISFVISYITLSKQKLDQKHRLENIKLIRYMIWQSHIGSKVSQLKVQFASLTLQGGEGAFNTKNGSEKSHMEIFSFSIIIPQPYF